MSLALLLSSAICNNLYSQNTEKSVFQSSVRFNSIYITGHDFSIIHLAPSFTIGNEIHNFYLGLQQSYLIQPTPVGDRIYEKKNWGLNFGYRNYSSEISKNTRMFGQFNYSVFQIRYMDYQLGPPYSHKQKEIIAENTIAIGTDYEFINKSHLFAGIGFGSFGGFFLLIDKFTLTGFIGIEYNLTKVRTN